ncbi:MAG TPA: PAS domain-containing sensor histidine kinase [Terriglobia bacterium]|nr:PAS domain-containing sensor histidine kinase [Terriglobia bacterium]
MDEFEFSADSFSAASLLPLGSPAPMIVCRRESGLLLRANLAARALLRLETDLTTLPSWSLWLMLEAATIGDEMMRRLTSGDLIEQVEAGLRRPDGSRIEVLLSANSVWYDGQPAVIVSLADITELKRRQAELAAARQHLLDAEEASRSKSAVLAEISHELRSPLNAILGFAEIIRDRHLGDQALDRYSEYAGLIHNAGTLLLSLINDLLDLSKIEAGKLSLQRERFQVSSLLRDCAILAQPIINRRNLQLDLALDENLALMVDRRRFIQMILNLLTNAAKFTRAGGRILISAQRLDAQYIAVMVNDNGIGMSAEDIAVALQPFGQVAHANETTELPPEQAGTGLGLPIVKSLVELHGGRFVIDSLPGNGTTIALLFPAAINEGI